MGSVHYVNTLPDGTTEDGYDDFVISDAETVGPFAVATEISDLSRSPADENGGLDAVHFAPSARPRREDRLEMSSTDTMTDTASGQ